MIEIETLDLPQVSVPLHLRVSRGEARPPLPSILDASVTVGTPHVRRLGDADLRGDAELERYFAGQEATFAYHLLSLSCTFASRPDAELATAWLRINLDGGHDANPVAYSMEPLALEEIRSLPLTVRITLPIVFPTEVNAQAPQKRETVVQALYEGTHRPTWSFTAAAKSLHGVQRLRMIVRSAAGSTVTATASVGATLRHARFGTRLFSYSQPANDLPAPLTFQIA